MTEGSLGRAQARNPGPERFFFVLAQGRSGTAFLASLLSTDARASVHHEPWPMDRHLLGLSRTGRFSTVVGGLLEARFASLLRTAPPVPIYGEVNSYLRYNAEWLRQHLSATLIHVVRDGRDFVRSAWVRDAQRPEHAQLPIVPDDDDAYAARWPGMSRFERLCWVWRHSNEVLARSIPRSVRLEDLLSSYDAFRSGILDATGLEVPRERWQAAVRRPRNTSTDFVWRRRLLGWLRPGAAAPVAHEPLPPWRQWDATRREQFWEICGASMERFGYGRGDR